MRISGLLLLVVVLSGCGEAPPPCHFEGQLDEGPSAGCLVIYRGKMLLSETRGRKFTPPGGIVDPDEGAQCSAERETWEETGVEVKAGRLFHRYRNGFRLYWCEPVGKPVPQVKRSLEIASAGFYGLEAFAELSWRFPEQVPQFVEAIKEKTGQ